MFEKNFDSKAAKNVCLVQNGEKMGNSKYFVEIFFVEIDLECFETYFKMKISKSKIFSHYKFFLELCQFLVKMAESENGSWDMIIFWPSSKAYNSDVQYPNESFNTFKR